MKEMRLKTAGQVLGLKTAAQKNLCLKEWQRFFHSAKKETVNCRHAMNQMIKGDFKSLSWSSGKNRCLHWDFLKVMTDQIFAFVA